MHNKIGENDQIGVITVSFWWYASNCFQCDSAFIRVYSKTYYMCDVIARTCTCIGIKYVTMLHLIKFLCM